MNICKRTHLLTLSSALKTSLSDHSANSYIVFFERGNVCIEQQFIKPRNLNHVVIIIVVSVNLILIASFKETLNGWMTLFFSKTTLAKLLQSRTLTPIFCIVNEISNVVFNSFKHIGLIILWCIYRSKNWSILWLKA